MQNNPWIQVYSGRAFTPFNPQVEDIDLLDIAHALSMICRYNGHTNQFYSVAEHCIMMCTQVTPKAAPYALMHDAAEAYMQDMARPIKLQMPEFKTLETRIEKVILQAVGLPEPSAEITAEIKEADMRMLRTERDQLMQPPPYPWVADELVKPFECKLPVWSWRTARKVYIYFLREHEIINEDEFFKLVVACGAPARIPNNKDAAA